MIEKDKQEITLKTSKNHNIWILKEKVNGFKYFGVYQKNLNKNREKNNEI